ncbi:hypothetical protein [Streptomyces sp. NPDC005435]|uniref:hypothetical protein n=1 Tax=Streptomyces sp. NPDC005435 TaxID=3154464 RepID=UPI003452288E
MPRGRHRHSPPLHRLLPSTAIAGVSVVCALGPWVFAGAGVLRALAAVVALTAVAGAVVMHRWDAQAGKQVADLTRARASDEWRFEERVAELETDLEEARELRAKLERRLRAKRAELAGLRNEHASLLRRYATAETERASALEGRRLLELESGDSADTLALPPGTGAEPEVTDTVAEQTEPQAAVEDVVAARPESIPEGAAAFSAEGAELYRRAGTALARLDRDRAAAKAEAEAAKAKAEAEAKAAKVEAEAAKAKADAEAAKRDAVKAGAERGEAAAKPVGSASVKPGVVGVKAGADGGEAAGTPTGTASATGTTPDAGTAPDTATDPDPDTHTRAEAAPEPAAEVPAPAPVSARHARRDGHFTVPTAVAVVSPQPTRRPGVEGGFDFFGTQKQAGTPALGAVQNEDLADVVGQEALALHKAEAESGYKPATGEAGQVIDLTAHDETEHIDVQGLRSVVS